MQGAERRERGDAGHHNRQKHSAGSLPQHHDLRYPTMDQGQATAMGGAHTAATANTTTAPNLTTHP